MQKPKKNCTLARKNPEPMGNRGGLKVLHAVESFGGGSIGLIVHFSYCMPQHQHVVIHGHRPEEPYQGVRQKFHPDTRFQLWPHVGREINLLRDWRAFWALRSYVLAQKPDILHLHSSKAGFLGRLLPLTGLRLPTVYSPQSGAFLRQDVGPLKRRLFVVLEQLAARLGGKAVCSGASEAAAFRAIGVEASHINNGIRIREEAPATPGQKPALTVLSMGRLIHQKAPEDFACIAEAFQADPRFRFVWVGDGPGRNQLEAAGVEVSGWLSPPEAQKRLQEADLYLSTALWEGLPFAVLEAMNHGLPLLLRDCVGNRDCVAPQQNGYLFRSLEEAQAHLQQLQNQRPSLAAMGQSSRLILKAHFDIRQTAQAFADLYQQLST